VVSSSRPDHREQSTLRRDTKIGTSSHHPDRNEHPRYTPWFASDCARQDPPGIRPQLRGLGGSYRKDFQPWPANSSSEAVSDSRAEIRFVAADAHRSDHHGCGGRRGGRRPLHDHGVAQDGPRWRHFAFAQLFSRAATVPERAPIDAESRPHRRPCGSLLLAAVACGGSAPRGYLFVGGRAAILGHFGYHRQRAEAAQRPHSRIGFLIQAACSAAY
jgi:hypothetical protein